MQVRLVQLLSRILEPPTIVIKSREDSSRAPNVRLFTRFRKHGRSGKKLGEYGVKCRIGRGKFAAAGVSNRDQGNKPSRVLGQRRDTPDNEKWSGRWESNPRLKLGKLGYYHYTTPASPPL
jgi:hypothetical protein